MLSLRMHMGIGVFILILMLLRLIMRLITSKPPPAETGNAALNIVGRATHWALYALVIALAASGIAIANMAGLPEIVFFGADTPLPADFNDLAPRAAHGVIANILMLVIAAHMAGFLYHQFIRKDGLIGRMWFGSRS